MSCATFYLYVRWLRTPSLAAGILLLDMQVELRGGHSSWFRDRSLRRTAGLHDTTLEVALAHVHGAIVGKELSSVVMRAFHRTGWVPFEPVVASVVASVRTHVVHFQALEVLWSTLSRVRWMDLVVARRVHGRRVGLRCGMVRVRVVLEHVETDVVEQRGHRVLVRVVVVRDWGRSLRTHELGVAVDERVDVLVWTVWVVGLVRRWEHAERQVAVSTSPTRDAWRTAQSEQTGRQWRRRLVQRTLGVAGVGHRQHGRQLRVVDLWGRESHEQRELVRARCREAVAAQRRAERELWHRGRDADLEGESEWTRTSRGRLLLLLLLLLGLCGRLLLLVMLLLLLVLLLLMVVVLHLLLLLVLQLLVVELLLLELLFALLLLALLAGQTTALRDV